MVDSNSPRRTNGTATDTGNGNGGSSQYVLISDYQSDYNSQILTMLRTNGTSSVGSDEGSSASSSPTLGGSDTNATDSTGAGSAEPTGTASKRSVRLF